MGRSIQDLLSAYNMMGSIEAVKTGIPDPCPDFSAAGLKRGIVGKSGSFIKVDGGRTLARKVAYGSPSVRTGLRGISEVGVMLLHVFEHQMHDPIVLVNLLDPTNAVAQDLALKEVGRQTKLFKSRFENLRIAMNVSLLRYGALYFDGAGNLLPSAGGAVDTIDFGIPAGNKGTLDVFGAGAIIAAKWSASTTNIPAHVAAIIEASARLTGYEVTTAYYGKNLLSYLMANDYVKLLLTYQPAWSQQLLNQQIPDGFLGLKWKPASKAFFEDAAGVTQVMWSDDQVTFVPDVSNDWFEVLEGTYPVPTDLGGTAADAASIASGKVTMVQGMFNYAHVLSDPVGIKHMAGDTVLPVLKVPKAVFQATIHS